MGEQLLVCSACGESKPLSAFSPRHHLGVVTRCKPCRAEWMRIFRRVMSSGLYDRMLAEQNGVCKICGGLPVYTRTRLDIDHDLATGRIRGLLCGHCNTGLGKFRDDRELLRRAADYLSSSS